MASVKPSLDLAALRKNVSAQQSEVKVKDDTPEITPPTAESSKGKAKQTEVVPKGGENDAESSTTKGKGKGKGKEKEKEQHSRFDFKKYANEHLQTIVSGDTTEDETEEGKWEGTGGTTEEFAPESEQKTEGYVQPDLHEGQLASAEQRKHRQPIVRPEQIEKHWKSMYMLLKSWWKTSGRNLETTDQNKINQIQEKIKKECHRMALNDISQKTEIFMTTFPPILSSLEEENKQRDKESQISDEKLGEAVFQKTAENILQKQYLPKYRFPMAEILGHMTGIIATMNTIQGLEENPEREKHMTSLLRGLAVMQEKLKDWNIPLQSILSPTAWKMVDSIVNHDQKTRDQWRSIVDELNRPTKDQENIWQLAAPGIRDIVTTINSTQEMMDDDHVKKLDAALRVIKEEDQKMQVLNKKNEIPETVNALPLSLLIQMTSNWKDRKSTETEANIDSLKKLLAMQPLGANLLESFNTDDPEKAEKLLQRSDPESHISSQKVNGSQPPVTGLGFNTTEGLQALGKTLAEDDVIEMFEYKNGVTEYGPVVAIRPCQTDNPRFTRFIVNVGTADRPHHRIIKATDLCPGGAEALSQMKDMETNFNLKSRKEFIRKTPNPFKGVGPCAVMSRSEGYKPRPESKPHRPATYVRVIYRDGHTEWLTRTEYTQLVGQTLAKRHLEQLVEKYETRSKYIDGCKQANLHPGTGLPLTQKDQEEAPWLFAGQKAEGSYMASNIDTESSFQEPELDFGDGPEAKTNSLKKPKIRAAIPTTVANEDL